MKQQLRDYQLKAVDDIRSATSVHRRVLFSLPTGGGKTTIMAAIVERAVAKKSRVLILVHRLELCEQVRARLRQFDVKTGLLIGSKAKDLSIPIQVATVQTLARRIDKASYRRFDLIIIDEAHRSASDSYMKIVNAIPEAPVVGFTATPYRADSRTLKEVFNTVVSGPSVAELIKLGYLVPTVVYADKIDLSDVRTVRGDYDEKELFGKYDTAKLYDGVVNKYLKHSRGTAICFCVNQVHASRTAEAFTAAGIPSGVIYAGLPEVEREKALKDFAAGKTKVLCNVFILTEGYDLPRIDTVILNRATKSRIAWKQMIGRGLRPYEGKTVCKVIDMGNNTTTHGFVEEDDEITLKLAGETKAERAKRIEDAKSKTCPKCFAEITARAQACQFCGYDFMSDRIQAEVEFTEFSYLGRGGTVREVWKEIPTEKLIEYADSRKKADGTKYSKFWVIYELERRKLIKLDRHEDGRIDLQGRPVAWWLKRAVKNEEQQKRIIERSQAV